MPIRKTMLHDGFGPGFPSEMATNYSVISNTELVSGEVEPTFKPIFIR